MAVLQLPIFGLQQGPKHFSDQVQHTADHGTPCICRSSAVDFGRGFTGQCNATRVQACNTQLERQFAKRS